jgi:hypothetical protein
MRSGRTGFDDISPCRPGEQIIAQAPRLMELTLSFSTSPKNDCMPEGTTPAPPPPISTSPAPSVVVAPDPRRSSARRSVAMSSPVMW